MPKNSLQHTAVEPFLNWAGGKRWFVKKYSNVLPKKFNCYIEPFLGAGSVYFYLKPKEALLGDLNPDLVASYLGIQEDFQAVSELLLKHQANHSDTYYYQMRAMQPENLLECAARFIYLNRTCFNGIYRVNLKGQFNVPKGTKNSIILSSDNFKSLSEILKNAIIKVTDFEELIDKAKANDLIFADPPYTVRHNINGFIKYNEKLFSWEDQIRLANALTRAHSRGVKIVSTNANHDSVRDLYKKKIFNFNVLSRHSSISAKSSSRSQFEELLIFSDF